MKAGESSLRNVLILADESANWEVAGLRQLDRLALTLNEEAAQSWPNERMSVVVRWNRGVAPDQQWLPKDERLSSIDLSSGHEQFDAERTADLVLSTRTVLFRRRLGDAACSLGSKDEIASCEGKLLRATIKSQDGIVSRFLNRPISRAITRQLLRYPITPSAWTLLILPLPIVGSLLLLRGSYPAIIVGLIFFHIYSVLDGCDGEIARAKFLESESGRRLDAGCDIASNLLLAISLGFGLGGWFAIAGLAAAALIALNEWLLSAPASRSEEDSASAIYPRHRELWKKSGIGFLGEKFTWWLVQLTKRDVAMLAFVLLGIAGRPAWIIYLLGGTALLALILAAKARRAPAR